MSKHSRKKSEQKSQDYNYCALPLASYASRPDMSLGRLYEEPESKTRTCFQRDRDRIIHASAFRRLKYKTQVFVYHVGDHYRTRLTHTLEVAQITRSIARALMVNEDLAEAIALAHDLGHTPFAHIGEEVLQECMRPYGGFEHNDQSLRILTTLERKYPNWPGLNLTWETLEGVVKHNGPFTGKPHIAVKELQKNMDLRLNTYASIEAQVAAISDDIAYNNHDIEDGLRAKLFTLDDLQELALVKEVVPTIRKRFPGIEDDMLVQEMIRDLIGAMVTDVLAETKRRLVKLKPETPEEIRKAGRAMVVFSDQMYKNINELRTFLFARMYRHYTVERIKVKVGRIIPELFTAFSENLKLLPDEWQKRAKERGIEGNKKGTARLVADYIAGMTDRYAIREHERMYDLYWDIR